MWLIWVKVGKQATLRIEDLNIIKLEKNTFQFFCQAGSSSSAFAVGSNQHICSLIGGFADEALELIRQSAGGRGGRPSLGTAGPVHYVLSSASSRFSG